MVAKWSASFITCFFFAKRRMKNEKVMRLGGGAEFVIQNVISKFFLSFF